MKTGRKVAPEVIFYKNRRNKEMVRECKEGHAKRFIIIEQI